MNRSQLYEKIFLALLAIITAAFAFLLQPFSGAIFWAFIFAILFSPLFDRLLEKMSGKRNLAATLTLLCCLLIAILPLSIMLFALFQESGVLYQKIRGGNIDFTRVLTEIHAVLPEWAIRILHYIGIDDFSDLQQKMATGVMHLSQQLASQALAIGQNIFAFIFSFIMTLYLLFFLLRDGRTLGESIRNTIPLSQRQKEGLLVQFMGVIRATVKGNLIVALVQGSLGGLMFWILGLQAPILWGAVMVFLSLFPAGPAVIWLPAAIYLLVTGSILKSLVLMVFGALVIGLIDNLLRPILVGKDTQLPDYVVLISTLGGLSVFGLNGFVIGPVIAALFITSWKMFTNNGSETPPEKDAILEVETAPEEAPSSQEE